MERCGFFDANLVGEEYDRVYLSQHFAAYFASFIGNGVFRKNAGELQVMALSTPQMKVSVLGGQGYINGYWYENTDNLILNIDNADGVSNRVDSVVLRLGYAERDMWLAVKKGTPAINPVAPSLTRNADYYELQLATISIPASSISIVQSRISDTRLNSNVCGIVTGLVEQADPTDILIQFEAWYEQAKNNWEEDFNDWFNSLQNALDENVAANLYLNIEEHKTKSVASNEGVHDFRVVEREAQFYNTETGLWENVKTFTTPSGVDDQTNAPGLKDLISGTMASGFFGEVSAAELITGNNLASQTGITQGSAQFSDTPWLKFASGGKILFVAKKPIRSAISLSALWTAKCVYGDEGDKVIVQNGHSYKVRLLKGANPVFDPKTPIDWQPNGGDSYSKAVNHHSEWNKLMCAIHTEAPIKAWDYPDNVEATLGVLIHGLGSGANGMYTNQDLHTHYTHGDGTYCWCQEVTTSTSNRLTRGDNGVSGAGYASSSHTGASMGWRPVLEFIA